MRKQKGGDLNVPSPVQTLAVGVTTAAAATAVTAAVDPITQTIGYLSSNPWLAGICYVILNLGGKHIAMNLTPEQEKMLGSLWIRPIIIFCLCFVATRNVVTAFWLTVIFMLIFYVIIYEASPFCLLRVVPAPQAQTQTQGKAQAQSQGQSKEKSPVQAPNGQLQMLPLFMRGPLAVPDTSIVTEEANYLENIAKLN
jgi:hypothetical protein